MFLKEDSSSDEDYDITAEEDVIISIMPSKAQRSKNTRNAKKKAVQKEASDSDSKDLVCYDEDAENDEFITYDVSDSDSENVLDKKDEEFLKQNRDDNLIYELDKYWPYQLKSNEPEDKSLLYLYRIDDCGSFKPCEHCDMGDKTYCELKRIYGYSHGNLVEFAELHEHPKALSKFLTKIPPKTVVPTCSVIVGKATCCERANIRISTMYDNLKVKDFRSDLIKLFIQDDSAFVYLKIEESTMHLIPKHIESQYFDALKERIFKEKLIQTKIELRDRKTLSDTFDFPEAVIPVGFSLKLRDYQLRTISWMKEIESPKPSESNSIINCFYKDDDTCFLKVKLGHSPYYLSIGGPRKISESSETPNRKPLRLYGGILADNTGSGKTVTMLGMIYSSPFNKAVKKERLRKTGKLSKTYLPSRANLIICPSNIYKQWLSEAKKCNPNFKIIGFSTIHDHRKVSWKDMIDADIIVVSYQFLKNGSYSSIDDATPEMARDYYYVKGAVRLSRIHYHRLILDEFHELEQTNKDIIGFVQNLHADYVWGLTGTPKLNNLWGDLNYFSASARLKTVYKCNSYAMKEMEYKYIKRNVPNLELPPIVTETVWVNLSSHELALLSMRGHSNSSVRDQIMKCCHYQLNERSSVSVDSFVSIDQIQKKMCHSKMQVVEKLQQDLLHQRTMIELKLEADPEFNITFMQSQLQSIEKRLMSAQSDFNYFENVFKVVSDPDKNECRICYDTIPSGQLSILPCSHLYCYECVKLVVEKTQQCPSCRQNTRIPEIYRIRIKEPEIIPESLVNLDTSKYSSKLISLYRYITELISTDPNARIILFLQYSDLADFMAESFKDLRVNCVRVVGNVFQRQNAITKFRDSKDIRLIMMSSEDSVSGINLTQATHVILLHPFWTDNGEATDLAYEKQGISRAYRFGLDHPLRIVRFAVRGTIEEEITLRRQNVNIKL